MLKAIIFDFNGIILNDEPLHFSAMRDAVAQVGIEISQQEYWDRYLPFDDESCLKAICEHHSRRLSSAEWQAALEHKSRQYEALLEGQFPLFPGAADLIRKAAERFHLALASGACRREIQSTLGAAGLESCFRVIVGAEDFRLGKPHPESFLLALDRLNARLPAGERALQPSECLVIEDSVGGVEGARAAGMKCLAVSNTYEAAKLQAANRVVESLKIVTLDSMESMFLEPSWS
jgi:HAD superfamily hydrolase (TIGR01509 family)